MSQPIRITEVSTMGACEKRWYYRYVQGMEETGTQAMNKGTLIHAYYAAWWQNGQPNRIDDIPGWAALVEEQVSPDHRDEVAALPEQVHDDVVWIMNRYAQVYGGGGTDPDFTQVWSEKELEAQIGDLTLQGKADGLVKDRQGDLWLQECKSMADWGRLDTLTVDPQMTHYYTMLREAGYPIKGIMYDAIKTYRWKRDVHPPEDSVTRLFIDRSPEQCEAALVELQAFDNRRSDLQLGWREPLRNINHMVCKFCAFRETCWEELAFPEPKMEWVEG